MGFLKTKDVCATFGVTYGAVLRWVKIGTFPKPLQLGARCNRFIKSEVEAVVQARGKGASDDEIKKLVTRLASERNEAIGAAMSTKEIDEALASAEGNGLDTGAGAEASVGF